MASAAKDGGSAAGKPQENNKRVKLPMRIGLSSQSSLDRREPERHAFS
jgi:hypothetical protein